MDGKRFDEIARSLAAPRSRRGVFRGALGGAIGGALAMAGLTGKAEAAPSCRKAGHPCEGNQTCCDGLVCLASGPGAALRCTPCPDGQIACGGVCIPSCTAQDQCYDAGVCDPIAQACTNPPSVAGTGCDDGDACTQNDACDGDGTCVSGEPVECTAPGACYEPGTCDSGTGACSDPVMKPNGTSCGVGLVCSEGDCIGTGTCTSGTSGCIPTDGCGVDTACGGESACTTTVEGAVFCTGAGNCGTLCDDSSTCPAGTVCRDSCCGRECVPVCDAGSSARMSGMATTDAEPTGSTFADS